MVNDHAPTTSQSKATAARAVVLNYGTQMPDLAATRALRGADVVLQTYHPLVQLGLFEAYFPHCRRFVYWNPSRIDDAGLAARAPLGLKTRKTFDDGWHLIDLDDAATHALMLDDAREALSFEGVQGLFVDDADAWCQTPWMRGALTGLVADVAARHPDAAWFLNRGFELWDKLPRVDAVLLESLTPQHVADAPADAVRWLARVIGIHLQVLASIHPAAVVHACSYAPRHATGAAAAITALAAAAASGDPLARHLATTKLELARELDRRLASIAYLDERCERWPAACLTAPAPTRLAFVPNVERGP